MYTGKFPRTARSCLGNEWAGGALHSLNNRSTPEGMCVRNQWYSTVDSLSESEGPTLHHEHRDNQKQQTEASFSQMLFIKEGFLE